MSLGSSGKVGRGNATYECPVFAILQGGQERGGPSSSRTSSEEFVLTRILKLHNVFSKYDCQDFVDTIF
jgi:hypothetical protein